MKHSLNSIALAGVCLLWSCAPSGAIQSQNESNQDTNIRVHVQDPALTLADYLIRLSGVHVSGFGQNVKVTVRGPSSFYAGTDPLYVVDGQAIGTSYSNVSNMISVHDIDRIEVLRGSDASIYGVRGGNGVILIATKGN